MDLLACTRIVLIDSDEARRARIRALAEAESAVVEVAERGDAARGNVEKAARMLGIGRATLYRRLAETQNGSLRPRRTHLRAGGYLR